MGLDVTGTLFFSHSSAFFANTGKEKSPKVQSSESSIALDFESRFARVCFLLVRGYCYTPQPAWEPLLESQEVLTPNCMSSTHHSCSELT
jgi:hypothetical protein